MLNSVASARCTSHSLAARSHVLKLESYYHQGAKCWICKLTLNDPSQFPIRMKHHMEALESHSKIVPLSGRVFHYEYFWLMLIPFKEKGRCGGSTISSLSHKLPYKLVKHWKSCFPLRVPTHASLTHFLAHVM